MSLPRLRALRALPLLCAVLTPALFGQASFGEDFDGKTVADLQAAGWTFRNQSQPTGQLGWRTASVTTPHSGTHYLVSDGYCLGGPGVGSNWAILPAIPNQVAGDVLSLYLSEGWSALATNALEIRYSPSGGTSTGSSATDVGDFTTVLATHLHDTLGPWGQHSLALPGSGRIALRYWIPATYSSGMYVDTLTVGVPAGGSIPLPGPGQTVHWDTSLSPLTLTPGVTNIVAGGTVVVDPGVIVRLNSGSTLKVAGRFEMQAGSTFEGQDDALLEIHDGGEGRFLGQSSSPVHMRLDQSYSPGGLRAHHGAHLLMQWVDARLFGWVSAGATASVSDCSFTRDSTRPGDAPGLRLFNGTLAVRRCGFEDGWIVEEGGYLLLDQSTLLRSKATLHRTRSPQTLYLDHLVALDLATGAPFEVRGFDVELGPNNVIQNNALPVWLESGGLAPGSTLPGTGNTHNWIGGIARTGTRATWSDVGLPYVMEWDNELPTGTGTLLIEPGVTARFRRGQFTADDSFWLPFSANLICRGTPTAPITLTDDGAGWGGLYFGANRKRPRLEYTVVENADRGVLANDTIVRLDSSEFGDNVTGAISTNHGSIWARGTRFVDNTIGLEASDGTGGSVISAGHADLSGATNPNTFAGNLQGVVVGNPQVTVDARQNWWGDPSGPTHASNGPGTGDSATPSAQVNPFRAAAPGTDHPPLVRLERVADILEEGTPLVLRWSVEEDGLVAAQRIEYSPHGFNPAATVLVPALDPSTRTFEITVPQSAPSSNLAPPVLRLVVTDDAGQEGYDEVTFFTPYEDFSLTFSVDPIQPLVRPGESHDVCWSIPNGSAYLMLDDVNWSIDLGGTTTQCLSGGMTVPGVSTDLARIAVAHIVGAGGRIRYEYSDYFSIRPDPMIGDAPPTLALDPVDPQYAGGGVVHLTWDASDDEALRSFDVQASYDGGRAWNSVVKGLPGSSTGWYWQLPQSSGIPSVRIRVIATDLRFQTTSAEVQTSIVPGSPTIGTQYCSTQPNSSGAPASIVATGSSSIGSASLSLTATGVPVNQFVLFLSGTQPHQAPLGSGTLCIGGGIRRLSLHNSGPLGTAVEPDVYGVPNALISQGTLYFQAWFRDTTPQGNTSNLTDGVAITFVP